MVPVKKKKYWEYSSKKTKVFWSFILFLEFSKTLEALERCHYDKLVKKIVESFLDMVSKNGFAENFNALTGKALRDRAYSWTSSIYLIIKNEYVCKNA